MKLFLIKIILFCIPILVISYPIDIFLSNKLASHNVGEFGVWNDLYDGKINADIIINGSSRAWVHFNPSLIEEKINKSCYNLGIDGQNFWLQYPRYLEYRKYNTKPKFIIQEIEAGSLSSNKSAYNLEQFLPYMLYKEDIRQYTKEYNRFTVLDFYLPCFRYFGEVNTIFSTYNTSEVRIKGYKGQTKEWNNDYQNAKKNMDSYSVKIDSTALSLFENYLEQCKKENIKVILVQPPIHIYGQEFISNYEEGIKWIEEISKRHSIKFYNFSKDSLSYQKKYYYNTRHLNKEGSIIFTEKMIPIIKENL